MRRLLPLIGGALIALGAALGVSSGAAALPSDGGSNPCPRATRSGYGCSYPIAAVATGYHDCHGTFGPRGEPGQGFFHAIRAKGVSCDTAREVIRRYLRRGLRVGGTRIVRGYRCWLRLVVTRLDPDGTGHLRCTRDHGQRVIRSVGHP